MDDYDHTASPNYVLPVPRMEKDLRALEQLTEPLEPPKRRIRSKKIIQVEYGFGDASGKGLGAPSL